MNTQEKLRQEFYDMQDEAATLNVLGVSILNCVGLAGKICKQIIDSDKDEVEHNYYREFDRISSQLVNAEDYLKQYIHHCGKTVGEALVAKCDKWESQCNELLASANVGEELYNDMLVVIPDLYEEVRLVRMLADSLKVLPKLTMLKGYAKHEEAKSDINLPYALGAVGNYFNALIDCSSCYAAAPSQPAEVSAGQVCDEYYKAIEQCVDNFKATYGELSEQLGC